MRRWVRAAAPAVFGESEEGARRSGRVRGIRPDYARLAVTAVQDRAS